MTHIEIDKDRKACKNETLTSEELEQFRTLVGQLGWIAGQTRPDLSLETCFLSSRGAKASVEDLLKANKLLDKAKREAVTLNFGLSCQPEEFRIIAYNDASFGNLPDGGSQGGFIIF